MLGFGNSFVFLAEEPNAWLPALWILVVVIVAGIFGSALWAPRRGAQRSRWYTQLFRRERDRRRTPPRGREAHPQGGSTAEISHQRPVTPAHARHEEELERARVAVLLYDRESEATGVDASATGESTAGEPPANDRRLTVVGTAPDPVPSDASAGDGTDDTERSDAAAKIAEPGVASADDRAGAAASDDVADGADAAVSEEVPEPSTVAAGADSGPDASAAGTREVDTTMAAASTTDDADVAATLPEGAATDTSGIHTSVAESSAPSAAADESEGRDGAVEADVEDTPAAASEAEEGSADAGDDDADSDADGVAVPDIASFVMLDELRHVLDGLTLNTQAFDEGMRWFLERSTVPPEMSSWPIDHQLHLADQAASLLADPAMELLRRARDISESVREIDVLVGERTLTAPSVSELATAVEAIARLCPDLARLRRRFDGLGADFEALRGLADTVSGIVAIIEATLDVAAGLGGQVFDVAAAGRRFGFHVLR